MNRFIVTAFQIFIVANILLAQDPGLTSDIIARQQKIEEIFRIQDRRLSNNVRLIALISDSDVHIRMLAVRSLGSLQDTSLLPFLLDRFSSDSDQQVRYNAAFAIGQTATRLSVPGQRKLESDIIGTKLNMIDAESDPQSSNARMIEEMGKFGTSDGLHDILTRFGREQPYNFQEAMAMSIARFAIRGISSDEAVDYLLNFVHPPDPVDWRIVYALQRIGDRQGIRLHLGRISALYKDKDPLVRMNLALLFSRIHDSETCAEILQKLAESDSDWRVRVNAFNALSRYDSMRLGKITKTYLHAFSDDNMHVAESAIRSFGIAGFFRDTTFLQRHIATDTLESIAQNKNKRYPWQLQAEAISAIANLYGENAFPLLTSISDPIIGVQVQIAEAVGKTGSGKGLDYLVDLINNKNNIISVAALTGLLELSKKNPGNRGIADKIYNTAIAALGIGDIAVTATSAGILGDSLFIRESSVDPLVTSLRRMRIPDDIEAIQALLQALGAIKSKHAVDDIRRFLNVPDYSVRLAAHSALTSITGESLSLPAESSFEPVYTDYDFQCYWSLPETVLVNLQTSRGTLVLNLYKEFAPFTVMSFLRLAIKKFYTGSTFHRVVSNFVVQGGDPRGDGWGGPGYTIRSEFSPLVYETGVIGMASAGMDTEGSQFFLTHSPQPHLDGRYTIFGKLVGGPDALNDILRGDVIKDIEIIDHDK
jgi:cyclophilin family peptidyl-prolyl cis-trans isomerase/HEAT repeat protein